MVEARVKSFQGIFAPSLLWSEDELRGGARGRGSDELWVDGASVLVEAVCEVRVVVDGTDKLQCGEVRGKEEEGDTHFGLIYFRFGFALFLH